MLESLITSKMRIKLLMKFFLNSNTKSYLRNLESEFGDSTNGIRLELNRMENAGLLNSGIEGNKKIFMANKQHPLFRDIHKLLLKHTGIDKIVDEVVGKVGDLNSVWITGDFARGRNAKIIDIALVGNDFDHNYIGGLIEKAESLVKRKIRFMTLLPHEVGVYLSDLSRALLVWEREK